MAQNSNNKSAFIATRKNYIERMDRIGLRPYLFQLNGEIAFDIDWLSDFKMAEVIYQSGCRKSD